MTNIRDQKLLYHLTSLNNVRSILDNGLKPRSMLRDFYDVANQDIIHGRQKHKLCHYVPFHWFARNPFDGCVQRDNPGERFVLVTVSRQIAQNENWKVVPMHPLAETEIRLFDYNEGFNFIDWEAMNKREYQCPECKSVCMAECLSPRIVTASEFFTIYCPDRNIESVVTNELTRCQQSVITAVNPNMFSR